MRRRTVQPENRSFVLLLRTPVTPFDNANFTKNANCSEEWNVFGNEKCELSANQKRRNEGANFWQGKVQNSSPIQGANFWQGKVQNSSPILARQCWRHFRLSLFLCISLSLSHRAYLTHNIGNASAFPIMQDSIACWCRKLPKISRKNVHFKCPFRPKVGNINPIFFFLKFWFHLSLSFPIFFQKTPKVDLSESDSHSLMFSKKLSVGNQRKFHARKTTDDVYLHEELCEQLSKKKNRKEKFGWITSCPY